MVLLLHTEGDFLDFNACKTLELENSNYVTIISTTLSQQ
jgi:hypothetical protein